MSVLGSPGMHPLEVAQLFFLQVLDRTLLWYMHDLIDAAHTILASLSP